MFRLSALKSFKKIYFVLVICLLLIKCNAVGYSSFVNFCFQSHCSFLPIERPIEVLEPLKDVSAKEKTSTTLCCKFSAPPKEVQWFKGQTALEASSKYSMKQKDANVQLIIQALSAEDSGEYRCQVGVCESKAVLKVEGKVIQKAFEACCFKLHSLYTSSPLGLGLLVRGFDYTKKALYRCCSSTLIKVFDVYFS